MSLGEVWKTIEDGTYVEIRQKSNADEIYVGKKENGDEIISESDFGREVASMTSEADVGVEFCACYLKITVL